MCLNVLQDALLWCPGVHGSHGHLPGEGHVQGPHTALHQNDCRGQSEQSLLHMHSDCLSPFTAEFILPTEFIDSMVVV